MFVVFGRRSTGRICTDANELVSTVFFHVFFVPVIPLGSLLVTKKGLLLDEGQDVPLNKKSVLAAYLRHVFFGVLCLGFAMAFDGLFLDSVVERDKPSLIAAGTATFLVGSSVWLWALFALGSKGRDEGFCGSPGTRVVVGVSCLIAILAIMFGTAHLLPKEPTLENIAADHTITDAEAIRKLAGTVFPEHAHVQASGNDAGVELHVAYVAGGDPTVSVPAEQGKSDAVRIHKASAVMTMLFRIKDIIRHGRSRHLSNVCVSVATTVLGEDSHPRQIEVYRVTIPREKFGDLLETNATQEVLFSAGKVLAQLGVVDIDNFSQFDHQR